MSIKTYIIEIYKNGKWERTDYATFDKPSIIKLAKTLENRGVRVRVINR